MLNYIYSVVMRLYYSVNCSTTVDCVIESRFCFSKNLQTAIQILCFRSNPAGMSTQYMSTRPQPSIYSNKPNFPFMVQRRKDISCPITLRETRGNQIHQSACESRLHNKAINSQRVPLNQHASRQSIELDSIKVFSVYRLGTSPQPPLLPTGNGQRVVISHFLFDMGVPENSTYIYYCRMCNLCLDLLTLFIIPY